LQAVKGCTCVVNQLTVAGMREYQSQSVKHSAPLQQPAGETSAPGPHSQPGGVALLPPEPVQVSQSAVTSVGYIPPADNSPVSSPTKTAGEKKPDVSGAEKNGTAKSGTPAPEGRPREGSAVRAVPYVTKWRRLEAPEAKPTPQQLPPAANSSKTVAAPEPKRLPDRVTQTTNSVATKPITQPERRIIPPTLPTAPAKVAGSQVATTKSPSTAAPTPSTPPAIVQAADWKMPTMETKPAASKDTGYVSSGVVTFDSTEAEVEAPVKLAKPIKLGWHVRLQERIATLCGKATRDVEVEALSDKSLLLRVKAHSREEADRISTQIFQMPELGPYSVSLDIPLVP
jgi:hypothetical protein